MSRLSSRFPALGILAVVLFPSSWLGACGSPEIGPPVAIPAVAVDRERVPIGGPLEMTYRFTASAEVASVTEPYRVAVQFLNADGEVMFTDDHDPPVATSDWQPGETVRYDRLLFIPVYPYVGPTSIALGLYSPVTGGRVALAGEPTAEGAYVVGAIELLPPPRSIVTLREGWHRRELDGDLEWRWSTDEAIIAFRNPRQDSILYLELDGRPDLFDSPQRVDLVIGDRTIDTFVIAEGGTTVYTSTMTALDFGDDDPTQLTLRVTPTFVPAELPGANGGDARRLGVRVFHAFLESR